MYTIIIADDEELECHGLENVLQNSFSNVRIFPSVYNSADLISSVENDAPDIIITDINMPGLNGLDAIEILREKAVHSKVIINTAYSEFDYAQKAIKLGAFDFLVKPLENETLIRTITRAMKEIDRERLLDEKTLTDTDSYRKMVDVAGKEVISSVILGKPNEEDMNIWLEHMGHIYWGGVFVAASTEKNSGITELKKIANSMLEYGTYLMKIYSGMLLFFFFPGESIGVGNYENWIAGLLTRLSDKMEKENGEGVRFGVSRWRYDYEEMTEAYQESVSALNSQSKNRINFYERNAHVLNIKQSTIRLTEELTSAVKIHDMEMCKKLLISQLAVWNKEHITEYQAQVMLSLIIQNCSREICGHNIFSWNQLRSSLMPLSFDEKTADAVLDCFQNLFRLEEINYTRLCYIRDALDYIEENYERDISLEETASKQGISSFYLSRLLTQWLRTSFVELLTSARINKAIKLIQQDDAKVQNLSRRVGYQSPAYFYKVFKKNTGMTVGEMREFLAR